jgi:hypothetical protein
MYYNSSASIHCRSRVPAIKWTWSDLNEFEWTFDVKDDVTRDLCRGVYHVCPLICPPTDSHAYSLAHHHHRHHRHNQNHKCHKKLFLHHHHQRFRSTHSSSRTITVMIIILTTTAIYINTKTNTTSTTNNHFAQLTARPTRPLSLSKARCRDEGRIPSTPTPTPTPTTTTIDFAQLTARPTRPRGHGVGLIR